MIAATVIVSNGLIDAVSAYEMDPGCPVEDLGNKVLMPGLVDCHVHINEPGRTEWEGFETATRAAAAGGITTLVDMPLNCVPVTTSRRAFLTKLAAINDKLWVDCGFWGGVIPDSIDDLHGLLEAGVLGVKSFLIDSGIDEFPNVDEADMRRIMPIIAEHDVPYLIHAELNPDPRHLEPDTSSSYQSFLASRPPHWETDAIELMIDLCRRNKSLGHDCRVHIVHLSTAQALRCIGSARAEGLRLTVETCPHYLTLIAEQVGDGETLFKCCPPIRDDHNRQLLWQGLKDRAIDFIVSDHSPCTPELKLLASGDIGKAWGGIAALQFGLSLIWTEARHRDFDLVDISRLMAAAPADFIGLGHIKGRLAEGYHADLMVFDDSREYRITRDRIRHRHKITPYINRVVCGETERTYLQGKLVYADNQYQNGPLGQPLLRGQKT